MKFMNLCLLLTVSLLGCDPSSSEEPRDPHPPARGSFSIGHIHHHESSRAAEAPWVIERGGTRWEIERLLLVIAAVELHPCLPEPTSWLETQLVSSAWAHVPDSALRLGVPFVEDLLSPSGRARVVGEIAPPLDSYCRLAIVVAPADDDLVNTTPHTTESIVGASVIVAGTRKQGSEEPEPFELRSGAREVFWVELIDPRTGSSPLKLSPDQDSAFVLLDKTLHEGDLGRALEEEGEPDSVARAWLMTVAETFRVWRK